MSLVCITGTRYSLTKVQEGTLWEILVKLKPTMFRHGDCTGADDTAALIADTLNPRPRIIGHPGPECQWSAHNKVTDEWVEPANHFARNRVLVDSSDVVLVCPLQMQRANTGGTWYTHDYALKRGKRVIVCWPDGTSTEIPSQKVKE